MTPEEGIKQIDEARWERDKFGYLNLHVSFPDGRPVHAFLSMRPPYCDRGHIQLNVDGPLELDGHDSFPRFFFSFEEANAHAREFLKWRLWKERTHSYAEIRSAFEAFKLENAGADAVSCAFDSGRKSQ
jgi:hypothetical protein